MYIRLNNTLSKLDDNVLKIPYILHKKKEHYAIKDAILRMKKRKKYKKLEKCLRNKLEMKK